MRVAFTSLNRCCRLACAFLAALCLSSSGLSAQSPPLPLLPNGVAYDTAGNLYFADTNRNQVYESSLAGVLTIVAGSGIQGFAGDAGPATAAQLNSPQGIAIGPDGTLYIADTGNQRIRAVIAGQITTFTGSGIAGFSGDNSSALASSLNNPTALAIDSAGALLVCDMGNHRIRRISAGIITTIAGTTQGFSGDGASALAAQLDTPSGLAVGSDSRIYIADSHNDRIRVIDTNGTIATLAGTGKRGYSGDGSAATAAQLALPRGLVVTSSGALLFADSNNQRVRMVDAQGTITTIAGNGIQGASADGSPTASASLNTPRGLATSTFGSPVLSDAANHQVRESVANGNLYLPAGLAAGRVTTVSLTASATVSVGQVNAVVSVVGDAGPTQGLVSLFDGTSLVSQASLSAGTANFILNSLSNGSHAFSATYLGDGVNPAASSGVISITIGNAIVTATANAQTSDYGQAIPALTGTLTGVPSQDANNVSVVFNTSATSLSSPGTYAITATLAGSAASEYTLVLSPNSGSLQIDQAATTTAEQPVTQNSYAGLPLVLTANVASSTAGTPTGTVNFTDGNSLIATVTLIAGVASATYLSPQAGSHSIVASYLGDQDFKASTSQAVIATVGAMPDFILSASTPSQTISGGNLAAYTMTVAAQPAPFTGVVYLSASGLPQGATVTFSPPQTVPGTTSAAVTMSIQTTATQSRKVQRYGEFFAGMLWFPLSLILLRGRARHKVVMIYLLTVTLVSALGCGARSITTAEQSQQLYTLQVKGTSTNLAGGIVTHATTVTLIVE